MNLRIVFGVRYITKTIYINFCFDLDLFVSPSFWYWRKPVRRREGVFSLLEIPLVLRNSWHFDTIKQILKSNDSIKFDLVLAERSGKCDNLFP